MGKTFVEEVQIHTGECCQELLSLVVVAGLERSKAFLNLLVAIQPLSF